MANTLSCPVPSDLNPLTANGFQLIIQRLPGVNFFCQEANLPGLHLEALGINNLMTKLRVASNQLQFDELDVSFMIDSQMANYEALLDWFVGLGYPEDTQQYPAYQKQVATTAIAPNSTQDFDASPGTLIVLGPNNKPVRTINFMDLLPTSINSLVFTTTANDVKYLIGKATFAYTLFELVPLS